MFPKLLKLSILLILLLAGYNTASASFTISRPSTNNLGLVGHWTFDGADTNFTTNTVTDKSGQGNTGVMTNMSTTTARAPGKIGQALKFDGVDDYVDVPDNVSLDITNSITVSAWVYHRTQAKYEGVVSKFADSGGLNSYLLYISNVGKPTFLITSGGVNYHNDGGGNTDAVPLNQWSYTVGTFDGRYVRIYRDGVLKHTLDTGGSRTIDSTAQPVWIGRYGSTQFFDGNIDEVRIYNRALSASEVKSLYNQSASKFNISPVKTLTSGLVGYWTFDGADTNFTTNTVTDKSGNGNTGTMINMSTSTARAPGKIGQALRFDGVDDYVRASMSSSPSVFTISAWIKLNQLDREQHFAEFYGTQFYVSGSNKLNTAFWSAASGATTVRKNEWYFSTLVRDQAEVRLYLNGIQDGSSSNLGGNPNTSFFIGNCHCGGNYNFNGLIDEVRIYNRALSASEVKQLYNMGR